MIGLLSGGIAALLTLAVYAFDWVTGWWLLAVFAGVWFVVWLLIRLGRGDALEEIFDSFFIFLLIALIFGD